LANLIGNSEALVIREKLIKHGFIDQIYNKALHILTNQKDKKQYGHLSTTVIWLFSQVLRGPPFPDPNYEELYKKLVAFVFAQAQNMKKKEDVFEAVMAI